MTEVRVTNATTGGAKGSKPEAMALLPWDALLQVAKVYGFGAEKYEPNNWRRGYDWSLSFSAMQRHLAAFWNGQEHDEESGLPHLAHAAFHVFALLVFQEGEKYQAMDDRPPVYTAEVPEDLCDFLPGGDFMPGGDFVPDPNFLAPYIAAVEAAVDAAAARVEAEKPGVIIDAALMERLRPDFVYGDVNAPHKRPHKRPDPEDEAFADAVRLQILRDGARCTVASTLSTAVSPVEPVTCPLVLPDESEPFVCRCEPGARCDAITGRRK